MSELSRELLRTVRYSPGYTPITSEEKRILKSLEESGKVRVSSSGFDGCRSYECTSKGDESLVKYDTAPWKR